MGKTCRTGQDVLSDAQTIGESTLVKPILRLKVVAQPAPPGKEGIY